MIIFFLENCTTGGDLDFLLLLLLLLLLGGRGCSRAYFEFINDSAGDSEDPWVVIEESAGDGGAVVEDEIMVLALCTIRVCILVLSSLSLFRSLLFFSRRFFFFLRSDFNIPIVENVTCTVCSL